MRKIRDSYKQLSGLGRRTCWVVVALVVLLTALIISRRELPKPTEGEAAKIERSYNRGNRKNLPTRYFVQVYEWHAVRINIVLCTGLLLTCPIWMRWAARRPRAPKAIEPSADRKTARRGLLMLLAALGLATALRAPRMDMPIWLDEQDNLRRSIMGYYDDRGAEPVWRGATWQDSFFENRLANNPVLYSVMAHASLDVWRTFTGAPHDQFDIVALRAPAFVAGLLAIVALWGFLRWCGYPGAASFSAFLFALHPEAIFFGTQARGYTLMLLFVILALWSVLAALRSGSWKCWAGFGLAQFLCIYSYTGSVYFPLAINAALGGYFLIRWITQKSLEARAQLVKLTVVGVFTAMLTLQAMLPSLVQANRFLKENWYRTELRGEWVFDAWNHFLTGTDLPSEEDWWDKWAHDERPGISEYIFGEFIRTEPSLFLIDFVVGPALLLLGLWFVWRRSRSAGLVALAGALAPVLAFCHHRFITGYWIHTWYLLYFLPILFCLISIALTELPKLVPKIAPSRRPLVATAACALFICWLSSVTLIKDGKGRLQKTELEWEEEIVFQRGSSFWIVTPDGRMHVTSGPEVPLRPGFVSASSPSRDDLSQ